MVLMVELLFIYTVFISFIKPLLKLFLNLLLKQSANSTRTRELM